LRISASSLSGWNLNYIRRCRIWILIVGIIIGCRHWYGVVRPPEWAKDASNNYSTKETANYRTPWHESSVGVAPVSIAAAIATADVPAIYPTTAASAVATANMSTVYRTTASAVATADVPAIYCTTAAVTTADVSPVYRTTASAVTTADVSAVYRMPASTVATADVPAAVTDATAANMPSATVTATTCMSTTASACG
jgi:hypothetical protein